MAYTHLTSEERHYIEKRHKMQESTTTIALALGAAKRASVVNWGVTVVSVATGGEQLDQIFIGVADDIERAHKDGRKLSSGLAKSSSKWHRMVFFVFPHRACRC